MPTRTIRGRVVGIGTYGAAGWVIRRLLRIELCVAALTCARRIVAAPVVAEIAQRRSPGLKGYRRLFLKSPAITDGAL